MHGLEMTEFWLNWGNVANQNDIILLIPSVEAGWGCWDADGSVVGEGFLTYENV